MNNIDVTFQPLVERYQQETRLTGYLIKDYDAHPELYQVFRLYTANPEAVKFLKLKPEGSLDELICLHPNLFVCLATLSEAGYSFAVLEPIYKDVGMLVFMCGGTDDDSLVPM
jgi:hypothetical protein